MPTFDVDSSVEPMKYDFKQYGPAGTFPEPSQSDFAKFQAEQSKLQLDAMELSREAEEREKEGKLDADFLKKMQDEGDRLDKALSKAIAKLFKDTPSVGDMEKLPYRHKQALVRYILESFSPEGVTSGTKS